MRFPYAWAQVAAQNSVLKFVVLTLVLCCAALGFVSMRLGLRAPLVIERGCETKVALTMSVERTEGEIEAFVVKALRQRFDSKENEVTLLSLKERGAREKERTELQSRAIEQRVLVNAMKVEGSLVKVEADRLLSVGTIRSAFMFPLIVTMGTVSRTPSNPYGLELVGTESVKPTEGGSR